MPPDKEVLSIHQFSLTIDGKSLGIFTSCTGLALSVVVDEVLDGGFNDSPVYLPHRVTYPPLVVSRPITRDSPKWSQWVQESVQKQPKPLTGEIACLGRGNEAVATWELQDVMPVAWRGPSLDARGGSVAMEEIEFVHRGFRPKPKA
ncbi:phage tail protein [Streptomyces sp. x-80]|uniref:phage tail protein n=1 Tax=Streptomyces sp. x-80 TaxID=2789282 RepID=UPI00397F5892